jgi:hypothetical protein
MGGEVVALMGLLGLTSTFALVGLILAAWMAWRIVEKAGFPGWTGLGAVLLTLTTVGAIVPLVLLWVFAFMRWPRDDNPALLLAAPRAGLAPPASAGATAAALPPPLRAALPDRRGWRLSGRLAGGNTISLGIDDSASAWLLTGGAAEKPTDLSVADPSVGTPHARLLVAATRLGLEDLGSPGGTFIDGARLLPEHGPRDITAVRTVRLGNVELALART